MSCARKSVDAKTSALGIHGKNSRLIAGIVVHPEDVGVVPAGDEAGGFNQSGNADCSVRDGRGKARANRAESGYPKEQKKQRASHERPTRARFLNRAFEASRMKERTIRSCADEPAVPQETT